MGVWCYYEAIAFIVSIHVDLSCAVFRADCELSLSTLKFGPPNDLGIPRGPFRLPFRPLLFFPGFVAKVPTFNKIRLFIRIGYDS